MNYAFCIFRTITLSILLSGALFFCVAAANQGPTKSEKFSKTTISKRNVAQTKEIPLHAKIDTITFTVGVERGLSCNQSLWELVFGKGREYMDFCKKSSARKELLLERLEELIGYFNHLLRVTCSSIYPFLRIKFDVFGNVVAQSDLLCSRLGNKQKKDSFEDFDFETLRAHEIVGGSFSFVITRDKNCNKDAWNRIVAVAYSFKKAWLATPCEERGSLIDMSGSIMKTLYDMICIEPLIEASFCIDVKTVDSITLMMK